MINLANVFRISSRSIRSSCDHGQASKFMYRFTVISSPGSLQFKMSPICGSLRFLSSDVSVKQDNKSDNLQEEKRQNKPFKFTTSKAHQDYVARHNFSYTADDANLPRSNNIVLATSMASFLIYFLYLREENDYDNFDLFRPVHEAVPHLAIPMIKSAIKENERFGKDTRKLQEKLDELMREPEKYGGNVPNPPKSTAFSSGKG